MKRIILLIATILLLTGCGNDGTTKPGSDEAIGNESNETAEASEAILPGHSFEYNEVRIPMNVDSAPIVEGLGEPIEYFEAASCAFQGLDKIYYYKGFELGTYPNGDKDYVSYVSLMDDSVATDKGIYLGSTLDEVIAAYGNEYSEEGTSYVYRLGETKLTFIMEEDTVTSITYYAIVEGLNN